MPAQPWDILFERHPHPMWIVDPAGGRLLSANAAAVARFGFPLKQMLSFALADLRASTDVPTPLETWLGAAPDPLPESPLEIGAGAFRTAAGTPLLAEVRVSAIPWQGRDAVLCMLDDVSERQASLDAIRRSHERFIALSRAVNGVTWEWNVATGELWRGEGLADLTGTPASELDQNLYDWTSRLHPDDAWPVRAALQRALDGPGSTWTAEYRLRQPDGTYREVRDYASIVRDGQGRAVRVIGTTVDVSPHRRAEKARAASERRLRTLFESSMIGIVFGGADGSILEANDEFCRIIGYSREELAARRFNVREITPPELIPFTADRLEKARTGSVPPYEKEYVRKDGSRIPVLVSVTATPGGNAEGFALVLDLSEKKRAQRELQEHQVRLQALFDNTQDAILLFDHQGYFIDANPAATQLLGYTQEEIRRLHMLDMFPDDEMPHVLQIRQQVLSGGRSQGEVRRRRKDGSLVEVEYRAVADITPGVHLTVLRDISARKRAERMLDEHRRRMEALFEGSMDAIMLFDDENRYLDVNPAACALYGYQHDELVGRTVFDLLPPGDELRLREELERLKREGRTTTLQRRRTRSGETFEVEVHAVANIVPGVHLAVLHDLRERRESERILRSLSGRLLHVQDEERRRVAREIHDSTAQGLVALKIELSLIEGCADRLSPAAQRALVDAKDTVNLALRELRTISYLLHPPQLDDAGLVPALRAYVEGFSKRSEIHVSLRVPEEEARLAREAETALFRIVQECLSNIHRHSGSPTARIRLLFDAESVVLEVSDEGRGLQVTTPGTPPATELGVGIAGMHERVRQLGGRLEFESGPTGTTVRAVLPRVDL